MSHNKTKYLCTRVSPQMHAAFVQKAQKIARPSDVLRQLVESFLKAQKETQNVSGN